VRRSYSDGVTFTPVIKIDELEIDILKRTGRAGASELHLTSLEQSLLYLLAACRARGHPRGDPRRAVGGRTT
jgi:DNA-binding response OmpR family regulator